MSTFWTQKNAHKELMKFLETYTILWLSTIDK